MASTAAKKLGRRDVVSGLSAALAALAVPGCARAPRAARGAGPEVALYSFFDLPRDDPRSRELSGIAWDARAARFWAVQDGARDLVSLVPDASVRSFSFGPSIPVATELAIDLEGVALVPGGFLVASERGTRVLELDASGGLVREVPLPPELGEARRNKSLESLAVSPDGRAIFTTTENALPRDAASLLRIVRIDRATGAWTEHAYRTDPPPFGHDYGVADVAAIADGDLLVLERGWARGHGNSVRIYRARLDATSVCTGAARLDEDAPAIAKHLVVDLADLPATGVPTARQPQPTPLLENYEGLALGPELSDRRRSLVLVSDDNARAEQTPRVAVLALGRELLG